MFSGFLIIDKPAGITSHDVVSRLRRILKTKKIGHTGTLDPFATGVLVMPIGKATRLARFLDKDEKEYEATIEFGFETDTGDRTGKRKAESGMQNEEIAEILDKTDWEDVFAEFRGEIEQIPPMYSAKKVKGKKLYELAREGIEIERDHIKITIYKLEIIEDGNSKFKIQNSKFKIRVACSAGTYIRTLAEDIGKKVGVGAHLAELRRTRAGNFDLSKAATLEELEEIVAENNSSEVLIPMSDALSHLPKVYLNNEELKKIQNGIKLQFEDEKIADGEAIRLIDEVNNLAAIGFFIEAEKVIQPKVVLV
jgi:tRNA pseudouridine55 synthase